MAEIQLKISLPEELGEPREHAGDRIARWVVLAGFVVVLLLEAWLLLHAMYAWL